MTSQSLALAGDGAYHLVRILGTGSVLRAGLPAFVPMRSPGRGPPRRRSGRDGHARPLDAPRRRTVAAPGDRLVARDRAHPRGPDRVRSGCDDRGLSARERPGSSTSARSFSLRPLTVLVAVLLWQPRAWRRATWLRAARILGTRRKLRDDAPHRRRPRRLGGVARDAHGTSASRESAARSSRTVAALGRRRARAARAPVRTPRHSQSLLYFVGLPRAVAVLRRARAALRW